MTLTLDEELRSQAFVDDWIDAKGEAREGVLVPLSVAEDVLARAIAEGERRATERVRDILKIIGFTPLAMPVGMKAQDFTAGAQMALGMLKRRINADSSKEQG